MILSKALLEAMAGTYKVPSPKQLHRKHNPRKRHEIDDEWIAGIRKWWKKIVKKSKTYKGRPKDSYSRIGTWENLAKAANASIDYLQSLKADVEKLRTDVYLVKGFWSRLPFVKKKMDAKKRRRLKKEDPEYLKLCLEIEKEDEERWKPTKKIVVEFDKIIKEIDDRIGAIKWYRDQSHPEGIHSPGGAPIYSIFDNLQEYNMMVSSVRNQVDEAVKIADKAISGRLFRMFSSMVKKKGDVGGRYAHTSNSPVENVVHIGRVTLIFRDISVDPRKEKMIAAIKQRAGKDYHTFEMPFEVEAMGIEPAEREELIDEIKHARELLMRKGLNHLWYGEFIKLPSESYGARYGRKGKTGGRAAASYHRDVDIVYLYSNYIDSHSIIHELGHRYWFKFLSQAERQHFKKFFGKVKFPSEYGGTDEVEEFAELFTGYVGSRRYKKMVLDREQRNRFAHFLGRKRRMESLSSQLGVALMEIKDVD